MKNRLTTIFGVFFVALYLPTSTASANGALASWGTEATTGQLKKTPVGRDYMQVATHPNGGVALKTDGSVEFWGTVESPNPATTEVYTFVTEGAFNVGGIRSDGTVDIWGSPARGKKNVPVGLKAIDLAIGNTSVMAIDENGKIQSWGDIFGIAPPSPTSTDNYQYLAAGRSHFVAIKDDGTLESWGQQNNGTITDTPNVAGVSFTAVAGGDFFSVALTSTGTLEAWGDDSSGVVSGKPLGAGFVAIAAGVENAMAIKANGTLVVWGDDSNGIVSNRPGVKNIESMSVNASSSTSHATLVTSYKCLGEVATAYWGNGNPLAATDDDDVIIGTAGMDTIDAMDGDDKVCALNGDDTVYAGAGDDKIKGGGGIDILHLEDGMDWANGGNGDDTIYGGADNDTLVGGKGIDTLNGEGGADIVSGGNDADIISGGDGDDTLRGMKGDDSFSGGAGDDKCIGGRGFNSEDGSCETLVQFGP